MPPLLPEHYVPAFGALLAAIGWLVRQWMADRAKRDELLERVVVALERANNGVSRANDLAEATLAFLRRYEMDEDVPAPVARRGSRRRGGPP